MADLNVAHTSSPLAIHSNVHPPEPKKVLPKPPEAPKADDSHGPSVVLGGALAKPSVKPSSDAKGGGDKPNPFAPPKSDDNKPGQHFNHVV